MNVISSGDPFIVVKQFWFLAGRRPICIDEIGVVLTVKRGGGFTGVPYIDVDVVMSDGTVGTRSFFERDVGRWIEKLR